MFIGFYCCLLVRVQPLSLVWAGLHDTESLWVLFQESIVEFPLGYPILYLGTSRFSHQQFVRRKKKNREEEVEGEESTNLS